MTTEGPTSAGVTGTGNRRPPDALSPAQRPGRVSQGERLDRPELDRRGAPAPRAHYPRFASPIADVIGAITAVATVTTLVARPESAGVIGDAGDAFARSLRAAAGLPDLPPRPRPPRPAPRPPSRALPGRIEFEPLPLAPVLAPMPRVDPIEL